MSDCVYHRVNPDSTQHQVRLHVRGLSIDYRCRHSLSSADVPVAAVSLHVIQLEEEVSESDLNKRVQNIFQKLGQNIHLIHSDELKTRFLLGVNTR